MKVVINTCPGGFGLSSEVVAFLLAQHSPLIVKTTFKEAKYDRSCISLSNLRPLEGTKFFCDQYGSLFDFDNELIYDVNIFELEPSDYDVGFYTSGDLNLRTRDDLIEAVEHLGDKANGYLAKLKVVDIQDPRITISNIKLCENLGQESLQEIGRIWE